MADTAVAASSKKGGSRRNKGRQLEVVGKWDELGAEEIEAEVRAREARAAAELAAQQQAAGGKGENNWRTGEVTDTLPDAPTSFQIIVKNLPFDNVSPAAIKALFVGATNVKMEYHKDGKFRGYCYVEFASMADRDHAVAKSHSITFQGRSLKVELRLSSDNDKKEQPAARMPKKVTSREDLEWQLGSTAQPEPGAFGEKRQQREPRERAEFSRDALGSAAQPDQPQGGFGGKEQPAPRSEFTRDALGSAAQPTFIGGGKEPKERAEFSRDMLGSEAQPETSGGFGRGLAPKSFSRDDLFGGEQQTNTSPSQNREGGRGGGFRTGKPKEQPQGAQGGEISRDFFGSQQQRFRDPAADDVKANDSTTAPSGGGGGGGWRSSAPLEQPADAPAGPAVQPREIKQRQPASAAQEDKAEPGKKEAPAPAAPKKDVKPAPPSVPLQTKAIIKVFTNDTAPKVGKSIAQPPADKKPEAPKPAAPAKETPKPATPTPAPAKDVPKPATPAAPVAVQQRPKAPQAAPAKEPVAPKESTAAKEPAKVKSPQPGPAKPATPPPPLEKSKPAKKKEDDGWHTAGGKRAEKEEKPAAVPEKEKKAAAPAPKKSK